MSSIMQVQQDLLGRMQQLQEAAGSPAIKPAAEAAPDAGGLFMSAMRSVDAQQHQASAAAAAVDSGKSDDLVGAMIDSQKASVSFSALLQVRNKLTTAFDDVMRMPL
ncbi:MULTISPECIES: flagellar hook-basal body complex protein FliE [Pseudomonadaceae]|uniref:Flagellar hook-basal body complex protein FliE n=1 Tax=Pseudomonas knackmussii TaxID=65741 RepID=A0ABY4KQM3_9PSED|nr:MULTISPECIES: flagellar hook-basal body complex protein FliE [Pseudomonas]UPQ82984.1 flagellar hook-basal body complex protein FliE [Pseudomonas knackmussii]